MPAPTPRIAIIGAGPAGLMLASILHHNGIPSTIFERDSSAVARSQGGTLDIHEYSGQQALDAAGLLDEFRVVMRQGGDTIKILAKDGTVLFDDSAEPKDHAATTSPDTDPNSKFIKGRPEIDRPALKDLLIASLPADTIRWGLAVASTAPVPGSAQWTLSLADGTSPASFDLVVGADGAWSRTRALLTARQPEYSGITALDVWLQNVDDAAPEVARFVGAGNCFLFTTDRALLFQRNGQGAEGSVRCYACVKTDTTTPPGPAALLGLGDERAEVDWTDARTRERFVERYFGDWDEEVKRTVLALSAQPVLRPLHMLPVGLTWEPRPGVTLVGDAAHLMTPFAGVGVNVALMDALELARGVIDCVETGPADGRGLAEMLQRYEKGMFARSAKEAAKTEAAMHLQFREGGAERMISIMRNAGSQPEDVVFE